jgi:hypothetical protein
VPRFIGLALAICLVAIFAYLSRFWIFDLWSRDGLLGYSVLRPGGDLWRRWMNDLGFGSYDVILWVVGVFAVLTVVQKIWDRFAGGH